MLVPLLVLVLLRPLLLLLPCEADEEAVPAGGGAKMKGVCTEEVVDGVHNDDPPPFYLKIKKKT